MPSEMLLENPSEISEQIPDDYVGQKMEGFENELEFPKSITLKSGVTFERGFVEDNTGNIFYSRPLENSTFREILLIDKQGTILNHVLPPNKDTATILKEQMQKKI